MSRRPTWEELYKRFEPERPVQNPAFRANRHLSPVEAILQALDMPFADPRILLTGTVGTGKTTELLRIVEARQSKDFVVFLDLDRYFSEVVRDSPALQHISSWEVCFLVGIMLIAAARDKLSYEFPPDHLQDLERAWADAAKVTGTLPQGHVDPADSGKSVAGMASLVESVAGVASTIATVAGLEPTIAASMVAVKATAGAVKSVLPLGKSKRTLSDQDREMQTLLRSVNVLIGLTQKVNRRLLFVIDGLDRIRDIDRAKALFVNSQMIAQLACPIVVCGPFVLRHHQATTAVRKFTRTYVLANEPVLLQADPEQHGPGVSFFCELFAKRSVDLGAVNLIPRNLLETLAYRSGGLARDFVAFIRDLAELAWQKDVPVATEELVRKVLDDQRRVREMGLHKGHIALLRQIVADPNHERPEGDLAQELLTYQNVLPYPNESEWYYPHPLLTMHLIRPTPGSRESGSR